MRGGQLILLLALVLKSALVVEIGRLGSHIESFCLSRCEEQKDLSRSINLQQQKLWQEVSHG